ncbi:MAG: hypothetical protein LBN34_08860 [Clostridiales Family XIII bacterium]|jgi:hypothetical protein|nr:hypothetical protein [Clostridiales Family XIII bacterium]
MTIDQLSVFVENRSGTLFEITEALSGAGIGIIAFTVADTSEFGVLRLIVDSPKKALAVLKLEGFIASITPVIGIKMDDSPGSLSTILSALSKASLSIEYIYAFVAKKENSAFSIIRVEDNEKAIAILADAGFKTVAQKELEI